jgi:hypothetical protein
VSTVHPPGVPDRASGSLWRLARWMRNATTTAIKTAWMTIIAATVPRPLCNAVFHRPMSKSPGYPCHPRMNTLVGNVRISANIYGEVGQLEDPRLNFDISLKYSAVATTELRTKYETAAVNGQKNRRSRPFDPASSVMRAVCPEVVEG